MKRKYHSSSWVNSISDPYQRTVARFMDKVVRSDLTECWEWGAAVDKDGYGVFQYAGINGEKKSEKRRAPRISYELFNGDIPAEMIICHRCDNPSCVNPKHLFIGSTEDNVEDRVIKQRGSSGKRHGRQTKPEAFITADINRRRTVVFYGRIVTPHQIAEETGIPVRIIIRRLNLGWTAERAVTTPPANKGQDISWWNNRKK